MGYGSYNRKIKISKISAQSSQDVSCVERSSAAQRFKPGLWSTTLISGYHTTKTCRSKPVTPLLQLCCSSVSRYDLCCSSTKTCRGKPVTHVLYKAYVHASFCVCWYGLSLYLLHCHQRSFAFLVPSLEKYFRKHAQNWKSKRNFIHSVYSTPAKGPLRQRTEYKPPLTISRLSPCLRSCVTHYPNDNRRGKKRKKGKRERVNALPLESVCVCVRVCENMDADANFSIFLLLFSRQTKTWKDN
jgi:hypothetical protein